MFYGRDGRLALIIVDVLKRFEAAQNVLKVIRNTVAFIWRIHIGRGETDINTEINLQKHTRNISMSFYYKQTEYTCIKFVISTIHFVSAVSDI
jgi:hypothetical protein